MNHKDGSDEHEQMMESFYRYIGYQHIKNVGKEFDEISELAKDIEYPKELDSWFNDYLEKSKKAEMRNKRIIFIKRLAKRVAMVTLVLGIGLTVMTFSVDAFRIKFLNLVTDVTQRYTGFQVVEIEDHEAINIPADWNNYYLLDYVTNGYSFDRIQEFGENKIVFYQNSQGDEIQFSQFPNNNSFQVDTENAVTTEIIINGNKGTLVEKNGLLTLIWYNANHAFYLMGNIDKEEIIKMAESFNVKNE
ncbi:MAG: hypothetical protein CVU98_03300 [Firmicutes bacterium HGW-Firmicutes-3]|jgi:hypothetical protein|nr:MAG: hypothetical protein CVU98_03300 [Firmicutes bacterium HGW-Firmicutes-3]